MLTCTLIEKVIRLVAYLPLTLPQLPDVTHMLSSDMLWHAMHYVPTNNEFGLRSSERIAQLHLCEDD